MTRCRLVVAAAIVLTVAACSSTDAAECEAVVVEAVDEVQVLLDQVDQMTLEELAAIDESFTADFEANVDALAQRKDEANCSDEDLETLFREEIGRLSADSDFGRLFLDQFSTENLFGE